jgi:hypothetical protein
MACRLMERGGGHADFCRDATAIPASQPPTDAPRYHQLLGSLPGLLRKLNSYRPNKYLYRYQSPAMAKELLAEFWWLEEAAEKMLVELAKCVIFDV